MKNEQTIYNIIKNTEFSQFLSDNTIKSNFENYSKEKWQELSENFNFHGIILPITWNISLPIKSKNKDFNFYAI